MICDACVDEAVAAKKEGTLQTDHRTACQCGFCDSSVSPLFIRQVDDQSFPPAACEDCIDVLEGQVSESRLANELSAALSDADVQNKPSGMLFRRAAAIFENQGLSFQSAARLLSWDVDSVRQVYNDGQKLSNKKLSPPTEADYKTALLWLELGGMDRASAKAVLSRPTMSPARPEPQTEAVSPRAARVHAR